MSDVSPPPDVIALAEERSAARERREWRDADALRARIEAAGWRVVDHGYQVELVPTERPDIDVGGETIYGSVASVPTRLHEPPTTAVSIIVLPTPESSSPNEALTALAGHRPDDSQVLVVVDRTTPVDGSVDEIVRSVETLSAGDAVQAGLRRSCGALIVVLDAHRLPQGEIVAPLAESLGDPAVAIAGSDGLSSSDLRRFHAAPPGRVVALRSGCYAFRRADALARGPIDSRLRRPDGVATWWSLVLRDEGPDRAPRRALALDLPIGHARDDIPSRVHDVRDGKRDTYRIADLLGDRTWLAEEEPLARVVGDGAHQGEDTDDAHEADDPGGP